MSALNHKIADLLARVALRDPSAAPEVRRLARDLSALADALEAAGGGKCPGGASDRVQMSLIGPDGRPKANTDTDRN